MELTEIFVNAQAFFEWNGQEWEMTVRAATKEAAEALAKEQADAYLSEWAADQNAANEKYGVYPF